MINKESLIKDIKRMGIAPADTVLLHSSMKAIGPVDGGAEAVLDALMDYFSPGLLCFPTLSWQTVDAKPRVYDVANTPSIVGILPELFRKRPHVYRSYNPTHSIAAYGADAEAFIADDHKTGTPCGLGSTWHKLVDRDAFILMVGCRLTTCTFLHGVEEWCDIPGRIAKPLAFTLILPDGTQTVIHSATHSAHPSTNYWKIEEGLMKHGFMKEDSFGQARTLVLRARELYAYTAGCLSANPGLFDEEKEPALNR
ncbi:MAG: AAC(3) family N-acetyltransferase [Clostridiales bacterium]|nr:AAC(3) family N-acetyltransferase [Clostridiales bacterium]